MKFRFPFILDFPTNYEFDRIIINKFSAFPHSIYPNKYTFICLFPNHTTICKCYCL